MATNKFSDGPMLVGGSYFNGFRSGTVSIDPASLTTLTLGTTAVTITGVQAADIVILEPPATLEVGLIVKAVRAVAGGCQVDIYNSTAGTVDGAARTWGYKVIKLSA